ncbi:MAG TPA: hypothetical protein PKZ32_08100 [Candidatus Melainabacteria bacterium]|nr:hypothetical protein [Candidatus Melainabacteria bacterium]
MTVESLIFITLGLFVIGLMLKIASGQANKPKTIKKSHERSVREKLLDCEPLPPKFASEVQKIVASGKFIDAVKYVREKTGLDLKDSKEVIDLVRAGRNLQDLLAGNGNGDRGGTGHGNALEVSTVGKGNTPDDRESPPTAELQTIDNIEAIQRVQILISKGQTIEAVQYLCDNAGYDKSRALALVETMGKKVYSSD